MAAEIKTGNVKLDVALALSLRTKFKKHCAKLNVSVAQRIRDLMQADMKKN